jgi:uncharacterized protein YutE (UPF0331/DUF86 family)
VILIDEAPVDLRQAIMESGRVLLNRDAEAWKELRVRTMREYGDSEYYRQRYFEAQKRRLERGELSGRSAKAIESLKLESYLAELRSFRDVSRERFIHEPALHHLAERYLHLACESVLDIAQHVIADRGYPQASSYRNAIEVLEEEGLIDEDLSERLQRWMGFRNIVVHLYLEIDHSRVYDAIREDLGDFADFATAMGQFL